MANPRTEVVTEPEAQPELLSSVMDYLSWDHDRLDALEKQAFAARGRGALEEADGIFRKFTRGLRRHIGLEEELLFPEFERLAGMTADAGPTAVMRHEHRQIEGFLLTLERTIGVLGGEAEQTRESLHRVLLDHNVKEEEVLYPTTDRLLGDAERRALVERLRGYGR